MTDAAHDLYLVLAVLGLLPAVSLGGMPVLAQSAFVAVGSVGAIKLERAGLPIGGAVLVAVALGGAAGALTGLLVSRAEPPFVALSTWALAWLAYVALLGFPSLSGGAQGLTRPLEDRVETPLGFALTLTSTVHLVAAAVLCAAAYWLTARLRAGPTAIVALARRDDPELARSLRAGHRHPLLVGFAGAAGAAAGAGIALTLGGAAPADLSPLLALQLLAAAVAGTRYPLLGAVAIVALAHAPAELTAVLLLAAVALRRVLGERVRVDAVAPVAGALPDARGSLVARDLHVSLGGRPVLSGLDIELAPGEIHALIGPNGSGKTTALRVLAGELAAERGTVSGDRVARTFQREATFPALTPYRQILLALHATHHDERAWPVLALVGLTERAHAADLTAGEQRLLQIARAVATGAPVLVLDEPAVGMTAAERERLERALRALAGSGRAILVVEHDLRLVAALADAITVLDGGRAIAHAAPADVIGDEHVRRVYLGAAA
ncbi:MAG TPA: ATP-binding cassette domain-containing protein [Solirubrobacter sp.]|nr:ATP-binding cassette domain-containing protein [Solirubrobacter sp.]